jgi:hypothetical protein
MVRIGLAQTTFPAAPAVDSSASTSGTPEANVVESVRENRAMTASCTTPPMMGSLSACAPSQSANFFERRFAWEFA